MVDLRHLMAIAAFLVASCATFVPSPSPVQVLNLENRGGPAFVVWVNGVEAGTVPCNAYPTVSPGQNGLPPLPWAVSVTRQTDGVVLWSGMVPNLPAWYVQIGGTVLGVGFSPVSGPAGPTCPPADSPSAHVTFINAD